MSEKIRLGSVKTGNIATSAMLDYLLDERAEREDLDFRSVSSGPKMTEKDSRDIVEKLLDFEPDLVVVGGPNPKLTGPTSARRIVSNAGIPCVVLGDSPGAEITEDLEEDGFGYIIVMADSMIGARREFLDPTEMALFNSDLIKTLSITGAFRATIEEMDKSIAKLGEGEVYLPRVIIDRNTAIEAAGFENPYAETKAMAAFEIASKVAEISVEGCFKVQDKNKYIPIVSSGHEMIRTAASLADEARELEKSGNSVLRRPHADDGKSLEKRDLLDVPE